MGVLLAMIVAGCGGTSPTTPSTPTPPAVAGVAITVDLSRTRQTIEDVGGGTSSNPSVARRGLDPIGRLNLEAIAPRHIRLRMALEDWEPENDDGNPRRAAAGAFRDEGCNHGARPAHRAGRLALVDHWGCGTSATTARCTPGRSSRTS